jgi:transcriptional regulator with XRE-family HTH domain
MGLAEQRTPAQIELGNRIRARRKEMGLSQIGLAERTGLHFTFISTVERGERNLSLASLIALARGIEVDLGELLADLPD